MQSIEELSAAIISSKQEFRDRQLEWRKWEIEQQHKISTLMEDLAQARYIELIEAIQQFKNTNDSSHISDRIITKWENLTYDGITHFHKMAEAEGRGLTMQDFLAFKEALKSHSS